MASSFLPCLCREKALTIALVSKEARGFLRTSSTTCLSLISSLRRISRRLCLEGLLEIRLYTLLFPRRAPLLLPHVSLATPSLSRASFSDALESSKADYPENGNDNPKKVRTMATTASQRSIYAARLSSSLLLQFVDDALLYLPQKSSFPTWETQQPFSCRLRITSVSPCFAEHPASFIPRLLRLMPALSEGARSSIAQRLTGQGRRKSPFRLIINHQNFPSPTFRNLLSASNETPPHPTLFT